mmetsp:Transcript_38494/g.100761  ORF Transcript_38494/g.100761 Transcript_38494/m.100761 type:complete len:231 (-) Transcript_38494:1837-2529(-)
MLFYVGQAGVKQRDDGVLPMMTTGICGRCRFMGLLQQSTLLHHLPKYSVVVVSKNEHWDSDQCNDHGRNRAYHVLVRLRRRRWNWGDSPQRGIRKADRRHISLRITLLRGWSNHTNSDSQEQRCGITRHSTLHSVVEDGQRLRNRLCSRILRCRCDTFQQEIGPIHPSRLGESDVSGSVVLQRRGLRPTIEMKRNGLLHWRWSYQAGRIALRFPRSVQQSQPFNAMELPL